MREHRTRHGLLRTRWSAIGAAVAVTLGAGGLSMTHAAIDSGDRPVTVTVDAERILDTRTNLGLAGRFADGTPRNLQVTGSVPVASGGSKTVVPADAVAVLVNVTVVTPTNDGFLSLRAKDAAGEPTTSTVNFTPGSIEPNAATVDLKDGQIQIWVETSSDAGSADVLIDVVGYTVDHTHDDRYYTETEVDAAIEAVSNRIPIAKSAREGNVGDITGAEVVLTVTIEAPVAGTIQIVGSTLIDSPVAAGEYNCFLSSGAGTTSANGQLADTNRRTTLGANVEGSCSTSGALEVDAGTHVINLVLDDPAAATTAFDDATLDALYVPGGTLTSQSILEGAASDDA